MSYIAAIAGVVGAGTQIAGMFGPKGGGGGGGGSSMGPGELFGLQAVNPAFQELRGLFGKKNAKIQPGSAFGLPFQNYVKDLIANPTHFDNGQSILGLLGEPTDIRDRLNQGLGSFDTAIGTLTDASRTGLPTDASAYFADALRRFNTEYMPQIAERSGFNTPSSGFLTNSSDVAGDLLSQAATQQIGLNEAATSRRLQASPVLATLAAARNALPVNLTSDLYKLFAGEAQRPLSIFQMLSGLGNNQQMVQQGFNPTDPNGNILGALGSTVPGIIDSLAKINWGQLFNSNPSTYRPSTTGDSWSYSSPTLEGNVNSYLR